MAIDFVSIKPRIPFPAWQNEYSGLNGAFTEDENVILAQNMGYSGESYTFFVTKGETPVVTGMYSGVDYEATAIAELSSDLLDAYYITMGPEPVVITIDDSGE